MGFSWWIHRYEYEGTVEKDADWVLRELRAYYRSSSRSARLEPSAVGFTVERGSLILSLCGMGPETWLRHTLRISLCSTQAGGTAIRWDMEVRYCGVTAGKNYLIEECKRVLEKLGLATKSLEVAMHVPDHV